MSEYIINGTLLTNIADAVRSVDGSASTLTPTQMETRLKAVKSSIDSALSALTDKKVEVPSGSTVHALAPLISSIEAGGGGIIPAASPKDVNFYDYDGTLLYSYTLKEAQALTALPDGPTHEGLVFDGWNYNLESVKSLTRAMNVGAMYATDDGATRIYIHLEDGRTSPMLGICPNGTVTVDWGDGTDPDTLTGVNIAAAKWTPTHNYANPGDYVIRLTVDGTARMYGSNEDSYLLRYVSDPDNRNYVYQYAIKKIEIGGGISIGSNAFSKCSSLASITIPNSVAISGSYVFSNCYSLASFTIPNIVTSIGSNAFSNCYSLTTCTIPNGVKSIGSNAFQYCYSLASFTIPNIVTSIGSNAFFRCSSLASITIPNSVTSIGSNAFQYCYSLASITIPNSVTSIGSNVFSTCYGIANITIPNSVTRIENGAFSTCYSIAYYDFTALSTVPTLSNTNAFMSIATDCKIRVPAALVDEWKAATNWATYADYIVGV